MTTPTLVRLQATFRRHRKAIVLGLASAILFARLASEMREGEADPIDARIARVVDAFRGTRLDPLMTTLTAVGGEIVMSSIGIGIFIALLALRRRHDARFFAVGSGGAMLVNIALKFSFNRPRPDGALRYLISTTRFSSFPSGHAMGTTAVCACIVVLLHEHASPRATRVAMALSMLFVSGVGVSRVYLGAHYPSDVAGGVLAALAWVALVSARSFPKPT